MEREQFIFCLLRIIIGALASFFAIIVWNKSCEPCWKCISAATVISYIDIVYEMLLELGIVFEYDVMLLGIPVLSFFLKLVPLVFFLLGFILIAAKLRN